MASVTNAANEEVTISFGPKGMTVTLATKDGHSRQATFGWGKVAAFVGQLQESFRREMDEWSKGLNKTSS